jgi:Fe-S-cluster-containing hydrogenase component 2
VEACPTGALRRENIVVLDPEKCINCGLCVKACEYSAIKMSGE